MTKLTDISSKNPFEIPDNYFADFQQDIETRISEKIITETCGKQNPFSLPDLYFENFKVNPIKSSKTKIIRMLRPIVSIAALLTIAFLIQTLFTLDTKTNSYVERLSNNNKALTIKSNFTLNSEIQEIVIDNYLSNADATDIINFFEDEEISNSELTESDDILEYMTDYYAYSDILDEY